MIDHSDTVFAVQRLRQRDVRSRRAREFVRIPRERKTSVASAKDLVLLIDDSAAMIEVLSDVLHFFECDVIAAFNGEHGLSIFKEHKAHVSLVILDMNMPVMNGEETLRKLREVDPHVRVVISSSISEAEARRRCLEQGQELPHFLPKPFDLQQANQLVQAMLES